MMIVYLYDRVDPGEITPDQYEEYGIDLTPPALTDEQWLSRMRHYRDLLLAASDWTQAHDDPTGRRDEWAQYRQALRDFPATWVPGPVADFPESPLGGV